MKRKNKLINNKLIRWIILPGLLLFFWFVLTFIYSSQYNGSYTVISFNHSLNNFNKYPEGRLLEGDKITGEFTAQDDNLGIVAIRFKQQQRIQWVLEDILIFRIKEKGASEWYYQNQYYSGLTYDVPFLPIGFPIINDSEDKIYQFELESTKGNDINGLVLSDKNPVLASRYQMDKTALINDSSLLVHFFYTKLLNTFDTPDILFSSIVYLLPFMLYLSWITGALDIIMKPLLQKYERSLFKVKLEKIYKNNIILGLFFSLILISAVLYDVLILQVLNDAIYLVILFMWLMIQYLTKVKSSITFIIAFILLLISPISNQLESVTIAEKAAAWAFIFLAGGVFMEMIQLRKSKK